jgi:hypothetical protein
MAITLECLRAHIGAAAARRNLIEKPWMIRPASAGLFIPLPSEPTLNALPTVADFLAGAHVFGVGTTGREREHDEPRCDCKKWRNDSAHRLSRLVSVAAHVEKQRPLAARLVESLGSVARLRARYDESDKQQVAFNIKLDVRAGS